MCERVPAVGLGGDDTLELPLPDTKKTGDALVVNQEWPRFRRTKLMS